ncbi:uncharacterized protein LOC119405097 isoform X2 [Rhipicephalus sanguineus]|uniref:uncharacterized protein LOC119405097 isoform X2 n=1 Tax=Rhipicephalus sanguineus TaxID=34632 RepID=UPI001895D473|nr:uncharacterized protein LOC119405097 isoform X2 [Rhipicephalus sanguineus]
MCSSTCTYLCWSLVPLLNTCACGILSEMMPNKCCVRGCFGNYDGRRKVQVFSFPKEENLRREWIDAIRIRRKNFVPTEYTKVCADHFDPSCLERKTSYTDPRTGNVLEAALPVPRLRSGSVPTIFPACPSYLSDPGNDTTETPAARRIRREAAQCADVLKRSCFVALDSKAKGSEQSVQRIQQPASGTSSAPNSQEVQNQDHKVQSEQTCQAICSWTVVCDKGADQVPNSALETCIEDDEIALRTPSPPPASLAIGAYPAGVCIHHSHGGRRCNHRRPRVRARRLKKQSCAVIGCSNTQSKRRRLMAGLCREHKGPRRKCKCGVFNFHHPPPLWEHHHDWKVALSLPDNQINTNMWVCSVHFVDGKPTSANPIPTLRIGHINQGVQTAQLVRNSSDSWTWKKNVSTQRSGPTMCTAMCQAGEQTAEFFRDNATQWERPYEEVHAEHSYADMKWLLEYTSLKWLLRGEQADSE